MNMKSTVNLTSDPVDRSLRLFAIPMAFSFLINMIYSLIDRYYVSRLGDAAIAAIGSTDQVAFFVFTLASGFGVGTGIIVSRRVGEGNLDEAGRTATQATVGMALIALTITALLYIAMPSIPGLMRMNAEVGTYALSYMSMLFIGVAANLLNFQTFSIVRSTGNPVFPMVVLIFTTIFNAVIAPFLIFGIGPFPEMGMAGAGLATASAQIFGCCVTMWAIATGKTGVRFNFTKFRLDFGLLGRVAEKGFPASLQMLSVGINRMFIFMIVGGFGTSVTAAYTLGLNVDMLVFMCVFAVGMSIEVATGQNLGAGKVDRIFAYHRSGMRQLTILMALLAIGIWVGGSWFAGLYSKNPTTISEAASYFHTTVFGYIFFAIGVVTVRVISGAGASFTSMAITAGTLLCLQLPLAYVLSHFTPLAQHGVWLAIVIGYAIFAGVALVVLRGRRWLKAKA